MAIGPYDKINKREGTRIKRYKKLIDDDLVEDYNKKSWFKLAVQKKRKEVIDVTTDKKSYARSCHWKENYKKSDWYMFKEAVKA